MNDFICRKDENTRIWKNKEDDHLQANCTVIAIPEGLPLRRVVVLELLQILQDRLALLFAFHISNAVLGILMGKLVIALLQVVVGQKFVCMTEIAGEIVVHDRQTCRAIRVRVDVVCVGGCGFVCWVKQKGD